MRPSRITLINADCSLGGPATLQISGHQIVAVNGAAADGDHIVDVAGCRILPGLINAHDHLQLNSLTPLDFHREFSNAVEWAAAVQARLRTDQSFAASAAVSRRARLHAGALKNLLSGVTTVAHHDPHYPELDHADFPVRVPRDNGWSHSLAVDGPDKVRASHRQTDPAHAWIIHAAEGLDESAAAEFETLQKLGCLTGNTLLVHGVALSASQLQRLIQVGAGLIWCPTSNLKMFGRTASVADTLASGRLALGTDSRLTGACDLLQELRLAQELCDIDDAALERLVTADSAQLLRLPDSGIISRGASADLLLLPAGMRLSTASRADIRAVMVSGVLRYGDGDLAHAMHCDQTVVDISVDGAAKVLHRSIAFESVLSGLPEPGVELRNRGWAA